MSCWSHLLLVFICCCLQLSPSYVAEADANAVYSQEAVAQTYLQCNVIAFNARSETECAVRCTFESTLCKSFAFAASTGFCFTSPAPNADFSQVAPGSDTYRSTLKWNANLLADGFQLIGNRSFRIIQQRLGGSVSFARNWTEYENGFGDGVDFWLGLKNISNLTAVTPRLLRVEALTWSGVLYVAEYSGFSVGPASTTYTMTFNSYLTANSNTTSDSLTYHKGARFSTVGNENSGCTCPASMGGGGGWWFQCCSYANPSGLYYTSAISNGENTMNWNGAGETRLSLKTIRLMLLENTIYC